MENGVNKTLEKLKINMTQEEYKELQEKYYIATNILNQIGNAKRELKLYTSYGADILTPCQINNLKVSLPGDAKIVLCDDVSIYRPSTVEFVRSEFKGTEFDNEEYDNTIVII